ncbi:hypothetical protein BGY98DRAFT_973436 [Russula aff. rugulosa BPL654]|nr:hypothetical protein BGY98DRAFT_973436 [Russula aff. rugulosa BPL654]
MSRTCTRTCYGFSARLAMADRIKTQNVRYVCEEESFKTCSMMSSITCCARYDKTERSFLAFPAAG